MPAKRDLTGFRSGHIVVISYAGRYKHGGSQWLCRCELCGSEFVRKAQVIYEGQKTCGVKCGVAESNRARTIHGRWRTPEYEAWHSIKERCFNKNSESWKHYGGRGITMCDEWINDPVSFLEHVGVRPSNKHSIDRIDNNRGYEPGNVRWATRSEQARNMSTTIVYEYRGEVKSLCDWADIFGLGLNQVRTRWYKGIRGDKLFSPVKKYKLRRL